MYEKGLLNSGQATHYLSKNMCEVTSGNTWLNCHNLYMNYQKQDTIMKSEGTKITTELSIYPVHFKGFG